MVNSAHTMNHRFAGRCQYSFVFACFLLFTICVNGGNRCTPTTNPGACNDNTGPSVCRALKGASNAIHLTVTGTGFANTGACLYVFNPSGNPRGDVVVHAGSDGTTPESDFNTDYTQSGFRVTDIAWDNAWEDTGLAQASILTAAGKVKAVLDWIYQNVRGSSRSTAFCGHGFSGGSSALLYAVMNYGEGDSKLDHVVLLAATPFANIASGCDSSSAPMPLTVCPLVVNLSPFYSDAARSVANWTNDTNCGSSNPPNSSARAWEQQSILNGSQQTVFKKTSMSAFYCQNNANETVPQGTYVFGVTDTNLTLSLSTPFYNANGSVRCKANTSCRPQLVCAPLTAVCSGEQVQDDAAMRQQIVSDMQNNCILRH